MGKWVCKKCGGTDFYETIVGGLQGSVFDKEGNCIEIYDQDIDYEDVCCSKCDNSGSCIQDIAEWIEGE